MKLLLVVIVVFVGVCFGNPTPTIPEDNRNYVEGQSRYIWMNDDEGVSQLVDLQEPVDHDLLHIRNGADNRYFFFSRQNPNNAREIFHNNVNSALDAGYSANRSLAVIVHGWTGSLDSHVNHMVREAILGNADWNVIVVDWRALAGLNYVSAVNSVPAVGQSLGNFLVWLNNATNSNWNNVHLIGFSLGAHVVGVAGRAAGNRPARVTGLDPAGPLWQTNSNRLRASDGQYVEAIHTDGGLQGIMSAIGDANFYPNGGVNEQPGCNSSGCSHARAYELFAATVLNNHLVGRECTSIAQAMSNACTGSALNMGNNLLSKRGSGIFGLQTSATWPF